MPNYLALEWCRSGIRGLDAEVTGNTVRVRATLAADWPQELDAANDAEGVGRWLKSCIQDLGRRERQLIVLVSREDVAMRLLTLPVADQAMMADLVRYQTRARSSVPLDQLALDYVPLASTPPQGGRWVQTATVPGRLLQHIKTCADIAGLKLCSVGMTTVAVGETIARVERWRELPTDHKSLIVRVVGEHLELALWRGTDLLFGHVARATGSNAVFVEVQRALLSHQDATGEGEIRQAWLIAAQDIGSEYQTALATRLGCEVIVLDTSRDLPANVQADAMHKDTPRFVAALGALLASVQATVPTIDFLKPRRPPEKRDRTKIMAAVAVGLLLVVLSTAYLASRFYTSSLDQRIAEQAKIVAAQDEALQQGEPAHEAEAFLSTWDNQRVDWLDQMQRISRELPGTERLYLDRWRFDLGGGGTLGSTEAIGFARQQRDTQQLTQRLAEQAGFRIRPNSFGTPGGDSEYPILFQLNAELVTPDRRTARSERK